MVTRDKPTFRFQGSRNYGSRQESKLEKHFIKYKS